MRRGTREWSKECNHSLDFKKIKNEILPLFRKEETYPKRKPELLLPCEWLMGETRTYLDYEAASLTPKLRECFNKTKSEK